MFKPIQITSSLLLCAFTSNSALGSHAVTPGYTERAIAAVLVAEAGIDKQRGMTGVAEVIRNRAREKKKSPIQIVKQKAVFTSLRGKSLDQVIVRASSSPEFGVALRIADLLLHHPDQLPNTTKNATHFDRIDKRPYWAEEAEVTTTIGHHRFYRTRY